MLICDSLTKEIREKTNVRTTDLDTNTCPQHMRCDKRVNRKRGKKKTGKNKSDMNPLGRDTQMKKVPPGRGIMDKRRRQW